MIYDHTLYIPIPEFEPMFEGWKKFEAFPEGLNSKISVEQSVMFREVNERLIPTGRWVRGKVTYVATENDNLKNIFGFIRIAHGES